MPGKNPPKVCNNEVKELLHITTYISYVLMTPPPKISWDLNPIHTLFEIQSGDFIPRIIFEAPDIFRYEAT